MKFVLNSDLVEETAPAADTTLLRYLRESRRLCGTKEGCASGDCGACTVLLGELDRGRIRYRTVNACITPLAAANRRHIVTVENLASDGSLHPAQRELLDHHGSQCGFCTPGFVMSLAGLYQQQLAGEGPQPDRAEVCEAISGNLCRCTGYRPIVDAGLKMVQTTDESHRIDAQQQIEQLTNIVSSNSPPDYFQPASRDELHQAIAEHPDARLIAGGTDLLLEVTQQCLPIKKIIDLSGVEALHQIEERDGLVHLGAALTYRELETFFADHSPVISTLLERIGSRQIRNRGTLGGNIANASPIADLPPLFLALDAHVTLSDSRGAERQLPLSDFYHGYKKTALESGRYLADIRFPTRALNDFLRVYKISKRREDDISAVMASIRLRAENRETANGETESRENGEVFTEVRIAFGGMAATPVRATTAEAALLGRSPQDESALTAALAAIATSASASARTGRPSVRANPSSKVEITSARQNTPVKSATTASTAAMRKSSGGNPRSACASTSAPQP